LIADFEDMARADVFRPRRFICTWGVHLGGYVGGFLGTFIAAGMIIYKRIHTTGPTRFSGSVLSARFNSDRCYIIIMPLSVGNYIETPQS